MSERIFNLIVGGINVSQYVDFDSLTEVNIVAEEGIWNYKVDSVSVTLDKSVLDVFNLDEYRIEGLYKKLVALQYYDNDIFGGVVGEVSYNFEDEELELEIYSYGKVINELEILGIFETVNKPFADSMKWVVYNLLSRINEQLDTQDFPFQIFNQLDNNPINKTDFPFFRSLQGETIRIQDIVNIPIKNAKGVYEEYSFASATGTGKYYVFYSFAGIDSGYVGYRLTEGGIDINDKKTYTGMFATSQFALHSKLAANWGDDTGVEDYLSATYEDFRDKTPTYLGKAKVGEVYYTVVNGLIYRIFLEQTDEFNYRYEDEKAGQIQKDFAVLTNSITWVGPDRKMYFEVRTGGTGIKNPKNAISLDYDLVDEKNNSIEFPDGIVLSNVVKTDLNEYYEDYFNGIFHSYTTQIDVGEFDSSEYPMILKNLRVNVKGKSIDLGIIVSINYAEDILEIETQKRVPITLQGRPLVP